jgi:hypothetical protein
MTIAVSKMTLLPYQTVVVTIAVCKVAVVPSPLLLEL